MSFSEETAYADQIVIVDGIGITHFIPRRLPSQGATAAPPTRKRQKAKK